MLTLLIIIYVCGALMMGANLLQDNETVKETIGGILWTLLWPLLVIILAFIFLYESVTGKSVDF